MDNTGNDSNSNATPQNETDTPNKKNALFPTHQTGRILVDKKIISPLDLNEAILRKEREPDKYLGQILSEMGLPQLKIMKAIYYANKRKKLGEILVDLNIMTAEQLQDRLALQKQLKSKGVFKPLGALLAESRIINEADYLKAISAHFSMPVLSLKDFRVSPVLQKAVGEQYALKNRIVVVNSNTQKITVALADPQLSIFETLEKAQPKDKAMMFCLAKASEIENCLDRFYDPYHFHG